MTAEPARDPLTQQLMNHAQLLSQLRRDLDDLASETTDTAADLLSRLSEVEETGGSGTTPTAWCWRDLGPRAEEELWKELASWVGWIRARYPLARKIPPCWAEHPEIVEELTALWLAWQYAYVERGAPLTAAADWHDRWLPGVLYRLEHGVHALDCTSEHKPRPATAYASESEIKKAPAPF
jgi:hypothetical protein